jgi:preprotein translocase subunit SecF
MFVIKYKNLFFALSAILVGASILSIVVWGFNLGIDFKGGAILEIEYESDRPDIGVINETLETLSLGIFSVQPTGDRGYLIRTRDLTEIEKENLDNLLTFDGQAQFIEKRYTSIGPAIGQELARRGVIAILLVVALIILFIAFVFRHVSRPVSSWRYGLVAIIALIHDIIIPIGLFSFLGYWRGAEIDALFLTALLAILGLSVNDTIVIFDRIRENLKNRISPHFTETVGVSLRETFSRSINTSLTTLFVLLSLLFFGGETTKDFALVLSLGMIIGTYSSIFLAAPLLVIFEGRASRRS